MKDLGQQSAFTICPSSFNEGLGFRVQGFGIGCRVYGVETVQGLGIEL